MRKTLQRLIRRENLTSSECEDALHYIINSDDSIKASAFLVLLSAKGETAEEIYGIANVMKSQMIKVKTNHDVMDIVGTGGDGMHTFNISTASALIAASCGIKIAKHGNRAVSSLCGSADFIEGLKIDINKTPDQASESIDRDNFAFLYAPNYHPAMAKIAPVRRALGIPTCFNIIGPLLNPASAKYMMIGVFKEDLLDVMADVLLMFKVRKAIIYHGCGTDELTTCGTSRAIFISDTEKLSTWINPDHYGFKKSSINNLKGGSVDLNVNIFKDTLKGKTSATTDSLLLNAAFMLMLYGSVKNVEDGLIFAHNCIASGTAEQFIKRLSTTYQQS
ncbi:MAG TPA: anthranilate phosphoribosyltransferase [Lentisphaeria bacterium]|nr:MAG: anthranilate phosphoribosyltransferase [Lentisphaerae bacterium GWF2_38_69]HBM15577.1 anthranilate phosphoribosyltransferase [Lentisphaeria bacterium]